MFFKRTHRFYLSIPKDEFKNQLIGKHVQIHHLDFEVTEDDDTLIINPHTEQVNAIKTLPITYVDIKEEGAKTRVTITSEIRRVDAGGPQLIMIFSAFLLVAAVVLFFTGSEIVITWMFGGVSVLLFSVFWLRMQTGYFDYVRKVRDYVKSRGNVAAPAMAATAMA